MSSRNTISRQKSLELEKLEEERELRLRRDQEYLHKKYQILAQMDEETVNLQAENQITETTNNASVVPNLTSHNFSAHEPARPQNIPATSTAARNPYLNHTYNVNNIAELQQSKFIYPNFSLHSTMHNNHTQTQPGHINAYAIHPSQSFTNARQTETSPQLPQHQNISRSTLTNDHLHARQTVPKDLPSFSGSPEEWALFSSTYNWSTTVCGLTDAENLIRLQRALRGEALEAVKRILVHPSCVPHAMSTLHLLYGQPEK